MMYSKKVFQHFRNPKNLGEIKKPDGFAEVGNPVCGDRMRLFINVGKKEGREYIQDIKFQTLGCLPADEEVVLSTGGWRKIADLSLKSKLINSKGEKTNVIKTYKREYTGQLLKIIPFVSPFNSFSVTPEHPILCIKRSWLNKTRLSYSKSNWLSIKDEEELLFTPPDYVKAKKLQGGDFLVFPVNRKVVDNELFSKKMMRLLGYYLSEGYITAEGVINFAFNKNERRLIEEVKLLVFEVMGKRGSERTRGSVTELRFCSKKWADFLCSVARKGAREKTLSLSILLLPFEKQWEMVKTYILGDGDTYRRRPKNSKTYRITTVSKNLAIQIQEILVRGGIFASITNFLRTGCVINGRKIKDGMRHLISFKLKKRHKFVHKHEKYFLIPIRRIEIKNFSGLVYNCQVGPGPNSYLVRGFAVHNCGAAIATSSVLTEMVKGKTLEEAEKVKSQDVVKALGGLPSFKLHCSLLIVKALKKAIGDYKRKTLLRS